MDKPEDIPGDEILVKGFPYYSNVYVARAIIKAKEDEREMCLRVIDAEREWGGDFRDAAERIQSGVGPRQIPGWNCPDEDGNGG